MSSQIFERNGKRIQTHRRPFCTPKPDADLCMRVDLPLDKTKGENQDWATGSTGRRAAGLVGLRAAGPRGRRGPWAAGRWAAGLPLAKPIPEDVKKSPRIIENRH